MSETSAEGACEDPAEGGTSARGMEGAGAGADCGGGGAADLLAIADRLFPEDTACDDAAPIPAEYLLQQSRNANRYYVSFQRYSRQFIGEDPGSMARLVRWSGSHIHRQSRRTVAGWDGVKAVDGSGAAAPTAPAAAKVLFSWSSGEGYVQARRRQLQERAAPAEAAGASGEAAGASGEAAGASGEAAGASGEAAAAAAAESPAASTAVARLTRTIETESNRFIHARIQKVKAHHNEQISRKIHERRRRDHEEHLRRLRLKEEEYERTLRDRARPGQAGFFGAIFGGLRGQPTPPPSERGGASEQIEAIEANEANEANEASRASETSELDEASRASENASDAPNEPDGGSEASELEPPSEAPPAQPAARAPRPNRFSFWKGDKEATAGGSPSPIASPSAAALTPTVLTPVKKTFASPSAPLQTASPASHRVNQDLVGLFGERAAPAAAAAAPPPSPDLLSL